MNQLLPKTLKMVADVIGEDLTMKIVENYAGHRIYIPVQPTLDWALVGLLGFEAAYALSAKFGGEQIEIPTCHSIKVALRNAQIRKERETLSVSQIAFKYGLSRGRIQKIVNAPS